MTDIIEYNVDNLNVSIFDDAEEFLKTSLDKKQNYYDLASLITLLTTSHEINYQMIADFFLTFRSFISQRSLLKILLLRIQWCITSLNDFSHEQRQNLGKLTLVRTFVVIRHWLLNYFSEDFIPSNELRSDFVNSINTLNHHELFVQRIIANLKQTWTYCCNKSWDENVKVKDFYEFEIKVGPQTNKHKRLSTLALNQQNDPMTRNSIMLSTFEKNTVHKLPLPLSNPSLSSKREPKIFINPKNSNNRLSKIYIPRSSNDKQQSNQLYISLNLNIDPKSRNTIRDSTEFPKSPSLSKLLPPTPVKKMDIVIPMPPTNQQQSQHQQRGLRPLIESWLRTFHSNTSSKSKQIKNEQFMKSVVSVAKIDNSKLEELALGKFDILSARTIDELEYLVRFHNELLKKHGTKLKLKNMHDSFSFTDDDISNDNLAKAVSNIDNMNICETISNISKSVVSLQLLVESERRSYVSYDSAYTKQFKTPPSKGDQGDEQRNVDEEDAVGLRKKSSFENLKEFNFEKSQSKLNLLDKVSNNQLSEEQVNQSFDNVEDPRSSIKTFPTSIISESTEIIEENKNDYKSQDTIKKNAEVGENVEAHKDSNVNESDAVEEDTDVTNSADIKTVDASTVEEVESPALLAIPETSTTSEVHIHEINPDTESTDTLNAIEMTKPHVKHETNGSPEYEVEDETEDEEKEENELELSKLDTSETEFVDSHGDSILSYRISNGSSLEASDYDEIESVVSSYEGPDSEELETPEIDNANNQSDFTNEPHTPTASCSNDGLISSTPHISPIKSIIENPILNKSEGFKFTNELGSNNEIQADVHKGIEGVSDNIKYNNFKSDLNKIPSFTRISNYSISTKLSNYDDGVGSDIGHNYQLNRLSYLSKRSNKTHKTTISNGGNSIFSEAIANNIVNLEVTQESNSVESSRENNKSISLMESIESEDFAIPYPGVDSEVIAELAAISDDSYADDPISAALSKLEGLRHNKLQSKNLSPQEEESPVSSIDSKTLNKQVEALDIHSTPKRKSIFFDQRRKTKLFSLTPVQQKDISYQETSSKILLELLLSRKITDNVLQITNCEQHVSFILNYDSRTIAEQFTLIEKDALLEIDWKELVELKWDSNNLVPINSWLELLIQNSEMHGVDLCISRFNLSVNWIISEILLTKDITLRKLTIQRFIHIAQNCKMIQNYSSLMQILLALGSDKIMKLKDTWRIVDPGDLLIYKNLESISSPFKNFNNLRNELNKLKPSLGCVPFLGLYLSDLIFNKEKKNSNNGLINFGKFKHDSKIVRSLIQCIQWSTLYRLKLNDEVLSKCLYIKSLTEEEMIGCLEMIV